MDTDRYRLLAVLAGLLSVLALAAPRILAERPALLLDRAAKAVSRDMAGISEAASVPARPLPPPERAAALFGWAPAPPKPSAPAAPPPQAETPTAAWIRPVGEMENGDGVGYIFFKDDRTGGVFRVRRDGMPEGETRLVSETPDSFTIILDGAKYIVPRRR